MDALQEGLFSKEPLPREWPESIRLVSWNVNRGLRLNEIIEFLAASSPDLILLQETDVNACRTRYLNVPREIAEALNMNYVFGREFEELGQESASVPHSMGRRPYLASRSRIHAFSGFAANQRIAYRDGSFLGCRLSKDGSGEEWH